MFDKIEQRYSNEVRSCYMSLVSEGNVSANKVGKVISTVLESLTGFQLDRLPSKALLSSTIIPEGKFVTCHQVANKMLEDYDTSQNFGNVLHQDATTNFSEHYEGMQVTLRSGENLSIGLSMVGGGSADTYVEVFKNIIDDLAMAYSSKRL